ncbi:SRPBCC family protein [Aliiroseovarius sp. S1339]|uniref:SRPBCC family protein n=1 Tax=Aliiroseovarius sp. S1339 TaxID=2936990 RepID=UPI0020C0DBA2|nr:SRPBCC family protein [Aliiroseovarius sp. S1339]MCK8464173.1 SRPBCC family protein [Aliiroseovarius sp. S1339]
MSTFTETIKIDAPVARVWATLADIGSIAEWNPGLVGSKATNDTIGLGAMRYCDIDGRQNLDEEVVHFEPERAITFRITRSTLPFRSADIRFTLAGDTNSTFASVSPNYELKYGLLGHLLDRAFVLAAYKKGMRGLLNGLKERTEEVNKR